MIADRFLSKGQPQAKLNLPRIDYRGADDAVAQRAYAQPRVGEDRMVRDVEELAAKLQIRTLAESEPLEDRKVPVDDARADDRVPSGVAVAELRAARQPVHKCRKVEEVARILLASWQVRAHADVVGITAAVVVLNGARATEGRQRKAVLHGEDGSELPAADH